MKFYHGTTKEKWDLIKEEGILWGISSLGGYRHTYLSPEIEVAEMCGDIILEVEYEPRGCGSYIDNYGFDPPPGETCWQFSVFVPILIDKVKVV